MRTLTFTLLLAATAAAAQYNTHNLRVADAANAPAVLDKLALVPVLANGTFLSAHAGMARTTALGEAVEKKKVRITEQQGGATVGRLVAENTSQDTIYLMQGEVVAGGKQDRVLAQDLLLAPGEKREIAAFCVEQGRWEAGGERRQFNRTTGVGAQKLRGAVANKKEQQAVWNDVAEYLQEFEVTAPTGTLNALQDNAALQQDMARYRAHFAGLFLGRNDVVGVVALSGDQVIGCDLFATPALFRDAYAGLLNAYITEALARGATVTIGAAEAQAFLEELLENEEHLEQRMQQRGSMFRDGRRTLRVSWF